MNEFNHFVKFALIFLWTMGLIGGAGYCIYDGAYPIAAAVVTNSLIAFPTIKKWWKELMM